MSLRIISIKGKSSDYFSGLFNSGWRRIRNPPHWVEKRFNQLTQSGKWKSDTWYIYKGRHFVYRVRVESPSMGSHYNIWESKRR